MSDERRALVVGLGNPGKRYEKTRHNAGFLVVQALAKKWAMTWKDDPQLQGKLAKGTVDGWKVFLLMPQTYMNLSGEAVIKCKDYYKIDVENTLIIVDDIHIPFGEFRLRCDSGTGGHKGLQSVEDHLHTQSYPRLRVGVGKNEEMQLVQYVVQVFSQKEKKELQEITERGADIVLLWLKEGLEKAMTFANVRKKREEENL